MKINNKQSIIALLIVAVLGVVGGTYAYFTTYTSIKNEFVTGTYSVAVTEQFISPEAWTPGTVTPKVVNITNEGTVTIALRAKFIEEWTAADGKTELSGIRNSERVAQFDINEEWKKSIDGYYYYMGTVEPGATSPNVIESVTYNPNFYLEDGLDIECTEVNNNGYISQSCKNLTTGYAGAEYKLTIIIETIQIDQKWDYLPTTTLYRTIAEQAVMDNISSDYVESSSGIDFSKIASDTNGKGVYTLSQTANQSWPIHYYRGEVDNNHVIFGGYCWKIVRTTETGGVKLLYNGKPTNGQCLATGVKSQIELSSYNENYTSPVHVGYMYNDKYYTEYKRMVLINDFTKNPVENIVVSYSPTDNGDGTYTLNSPITIEVSNWESVYNNYKGYYICSDGVSKNCKSIRYIVSTTPTTYNYINLNSKYLYGNSFTYDGTNYTLTTTKQFWNWTKNYNGLNSYHYTCFNDTGVCETVYYIYYTNSETAYYMLLNDGQDIIGALSEMFDGEDINSKNSTIKEYVDNVWFSSKSNGIINYLSYIENTKWCNDRNIYDLGGWNPNGGSTSSYLFFDSYNRGWKTYTPSLECDNSDAFTLSVDNGGIEGYGNNALTYPVGLLTIDEIMMAGSKEGTTNENLHLNNKQIFWTLSPYGFDSNYSRVIRMSSNSDIGIRNVNNVVAIRPAISLVPEIEYSKGDGTKENPYVIALY